MMGIGCRSFTETETVCVCVVKEQLCSPGYHHTQEVILFGQFTDWGICENKKNKHSLLVAMLTSDFFFIIIIIIINIIIVKPCLA